MPNVAAGDVMKRAGQPGAGDSAPGGRDHQGAEHHAVVAAFEDPGGDCDHRDEDVAEQTGGRL